MVCGMRLMHSAKQLSLVPWILWLALDPAFASDTAPQRQLKTYLLPSSTNSADFSPDERLVVIESTEKLEQADSVRFKELVQLWDYKAGKLLGESVLQETELSGPEKRNYRTPLAEPRFVRFSPDGGLIAAYFDHSLFVLRAKDLARVNRIPLSGPSNTVRRTFRGRTVVQKAVVRGLELSPKGGLAAVLWVREMLYGRVEIYELSSGKPVSAWDAPQGWFRGHELAWHPNGDTLVLAIPNQTPCLSPTNEPDVFTFDVSSGKLKKQLTTGLLVGDIAVTADDRVLAVDADCMGILKDRGPRLRVFDLNSGKRLQEISGRGTGVRYAVSASRNGQRFLAFTGKLKAKFDWGDFVSYAAPVDKTFTVWNLSDYTGIVTSQDITGLVPSSLLISPQGHFALSYGGNSYEGGTHYAGGSSYVYELP